VGNGGRSVRRGGAKAVWAGLLVAAAVALPAAVAGSAGAVGDPVLSFGSCGVAQVGLFDGNGSPIGASAEHLVTLPDGRLLVVGRGGMLVLLPDGTVDVSFGHNGGVVFPAGAGVPTIHAVGVQPDGRIVVAGSEQHPVSGSSLGALFLRYRGDGSLDSTFGTGGRTLLASNRYGMSSLVIQADGRIVAADGTNPLRLDASGRLDVTYGSGGTAVGLVPASTIVVDLALQADSKLLVAQQADGPNGTDYALTRFGTDGTIDRSFGTDGTATVDVGRDNLAAIAVDAAGRILSAGQITAQQGPLLGLTRHLPNGQLDATFGDQGKVVMGLAGFDFTRGVDVVVQGDDKPVVLTSADKFTQPSGTRSTFLVARFGVDGRLDPTFGNNGVITAAVGELNPYSLSATADGGWVVGATDRLFRYRGDSPSSLDTAAVTASTCRREARLEPAGGVDFGALLVRSSAAPRTFTYTAGGTRPIRVSRVGLAGQGGQFRITSDTCTGAHLVPGAGCTVAVAFAPDTPGSQRDGLAVWADTGGPPVAGAVWGDSVASPIGWGWNGVGQLGSGAGEVVAVPGATSGLGRVAAVASGYMHTLALTADGEVYSWGWNHFGQLGDGSRTDRARPVRVPGLSGVKSIAAGGFHSLAVLADGTVMSWGLNHVGQLGYPSPGDVVVPNRVPGLTGVRSVSAGIYHSLALEADGTVRAWGWNHFGQLGDGTTVDHTVPAPVRGLTGVGAVAAGGYHSLALRAGAVLGWGMDNAGQVGDGGSVDRLLPAPTLGVVGATSIAAGAFHSLAVAGDGSVRSWGWNAFGQLGDGTTIDRHQAVAVIGPLTARAVAGGLLHSVALRQDGTVVAWGWNVLSQLGDGTTATRTAPTRVVGLSAANAVSAGAMNSMAN
jgi:uncharacterized delta-60 repeat protein